MEIEGNKKIEENGEQGQRKPNKVEEVLWNELQHCSRAWLRACKAVVAVDCRLSVTELGESVFSPADSRRWAMWGSEVGFREFARATNHCASICLPLNGCFGTSQHVMLSLQPRASSLVATDSQSAASAGNCPSLYWKHKR